MHITIVAYGDPVLRKVAVTTRLQIIRNLGEFVLSSMWDTMFNQVEVRVFEAGSPDRTSY